MALYTYRALDKQGEIIEDKWEGSGEMAVAHELRQQGLLVIDVKEQSVTQTLIPTYDGKRRVVACEVLMPTPGVRNLIREGKNHQIYSAMQTGGKFGMQTMDAALVDLVRRGRISRAEAEKRSSNPDELLRLAGGSLDDASSGRPRDRMAYGRR